MKAPRSFRLISKMAQKLESELEYVGKLEAERRGLNLKLRLVTEADSMKWKFKIQF